MQPQSSSNFVWKKLTKDQHPDDGDVIILVGKSKSTGEISPHRFSNNIDNLFGREIFYPHVFWEPEDDDDEVVGRIVDVFNEEDDNYGGDWCAFKGETLYYAVVAGWGYNDLDRAHNEANEATSELREQDYEELDDWEIEGAYMIQSMTIPVVWFERDKFNPV